MIELKVPKELLRWIETERGGMSRAAFIVHMLVVLMNENKLKK